jgi:hypothetical protein
MYGSTIVIPIIKLIQGCKQFYDLVGRDAIEGVGLFGDSRKTY